MSLTPFRWISRARSVLEDPVPVRRRTGTTAEPLRERSEVDRVTICRCSTFEAAPALRLRPITPGLLARCPGATTVTPRRVSHVGRVTFCSLGTCAGIFVLCTFATVFFAYALRTEYCCPESAPDCPKRGGLSRFAPAAMQASRSSSVSREL